MKMKPGCLESDMRSWLAVASHVVCGAVLLLMPGIIRAQDSDAVVLERANSFDMAAEYSQL